jgi:phage FluMu protein Com
MTTETRTLIETSDIRGLEIKCPECGVAILYPVDVDQVIKIGPTCTHCNHLLFDEANNRAYGGSSYPAIDSFQNIMGQLRALTRSDRTDIHADIRFLVNTDTENTA